VWREWGRKNIIGSEQGRESPSVTSLGSFLIENLIKEMEALFLMESWMCLHKNG
jgi:hypothetical protein